MKRDDAMMMMMRMMARLRCGGVAHIKERVALVRARNDERPLRNNHRGVVAGRRARDAALDRDAQGEGLGRRGEPRRRVRRGGRLRERGARLRGAERRAGLGEVELERQGRAVHVGPCVLGQLGRARDRPLGRLRLRRRRRDLDRDRGAQAAGPRLLGLSRARARWRLPQLRARGEGALSLRATLLSRSIDRPFDQPILRSIDPSIGRSFDQSILQSIDPSIDRSF